MMAGLDALVELSRRYGRDPDWVLAGGGNTSFKAGGRLFVKASGSSLADIDAAGFCSIELSALDRLWSASYPEDASAREAAALADLMAARSEGETKRPSVETMLHGLFPQAYVVHTHPAAVNGITCSRGGRAVFERLFGDEGIWVPFVDPGYVLAKAVRTELERFRSRAGHAPGLMFMENHGLLIAAESPGELRNLADRVLARVRSEETRLPDLGARAVDPRSVATATIALATLAGPAVSLRFRADGEILARSASRSAFAPLSSAFTPDHIVYAGHEFLYVDSGEGEPLGRVLESGWREYEGRNGNPPRIVLVRALGAFACAAGPAAAETALELFVDACKIAAYAENFGGVSHMAREKIDFIRNWEVERYRSAVANRR